MAPTDGRDNLPTEVHVEREKTKRTLIVTASVTIVGVMATVLFFQNINNRGGTLKVTDKGVEVTLEKPITTQVGTPTDVVKAFGDSVAITTGTLSDSLVRSLPGVPSSGGFTGSNFIDTAAGFVMASDRPQSWTTSDSGGVRRFAGNDGSSMSVAVKNAPRRMDFDRHTQRFLDSLRAAGVSATVHSDSASATVLVWYRDSRSQETVCVKFTQANGKIYSVKAETQDPLAVQSIVKSVSGFTPIEKKSAVSTRGIQRPR